MFKNSYQSGLLTIFYSCGSNPLLIWDTHVENGHIKRLTDKEVNSIVLEIVSTNVSTTYMSCPKKGSLGIKLPFLVMIIKNLKRYFSFEITILDDKQMRRRFRISNFQSTTKIKPFCTSMPIGLSGGWNQIQFNLADFTKRAYGSQFIETLRVQIHANVRVRRIYFTDRLYAEEQLPQDYKLYLPLEKKAKKDAKEKGKTKDAKKSESNKAVPIVTDETKLLEVQPSVHEVTRKGSTASTGQIGAEVELKGSQIQEEKLEDTAPLEIKQGNENIAPNLITEVTADETRQAIFLDVLPEAESAQENVVIEEIPEPV